MTAKRRYRTHDEVVREMIGADPAFAAAYLEECAQDEDPRIFLMALKHVVDAHGGVTALARKAGLSRPALHRALTGKSAPKLETVSRALRAAGFRLSIQLDPDRKAG